MLAPTPDKVSRPDWVVVANVPVPVAVSEEKVAVPVNAGEPAKTRRPVPVSSESAEMRLAEVRPFASSEATFDEYEKIPWSPLAIIDAERLFASTVQVVPLQVNEPKSSLASSVTLTSEPNGLPRPRVEVATQRVEVAEVKSTIPLVPAELLVSYSFPVIPKLVVVAFARVTFPVKVGAILPTSEPLPVSSDSALKIAADSAVVVALLCASVKSAREAVNEESLTIPEMVVDESVGDVPNTSAPEPVLSVTKLSSSLDVSIEEDATFALKLVQLAAVRQPWVEPFAVSQLSVLEDQVNPVPSVILFDGVV